MTVKAAKPDRVRDLVDLLASAAGKTKVTSRGGPAARVQRPDDQHAGQHCAGEYDQQTSGLRTCRIGSRAAAGGRAIPHAYCRQDGRIAANTVYAFMGEQHTGQRE